MNKKKTHSLGLYGVIDFKNALSYEFNKLGLHMKSNADRITER